MSRRGFFPGNLKGHQVPKFNVSLVGPQPITIHLSLLYSFSVRTQIGLLGGFTLGVIPVGYPKRPILGASAPKRSEPMQPWEAPC